MDENNVDSRCDTGDGCNSAPSAEKVAPKKSRSKGKKADRQRKKELENQIRKKVAHEEKSFRVVEKLVEMCVNSEKDLIEAGQVIDQAMYEDIVEERSIASVCGYPVCGNTLKLVPKQKYHISTLSNKVYDISDRKRYCSGLCYKASRFFSSQISTSPVWSREDDEPIRFTLMDRDQCTKGSTGEVVIDHPAAEVRKQLDVVQQMDRLTDDTKQMQKRMDDRQLVDRMKEDKKQIDTLKDSKQQIDRLAKDRSQVDGLMNDKKQIDRLKDDRELDALLGEPPGDSGLMTLDDVAKQLVDLHLLDEDPDFSRGGRETHQVECSAEEKNPLDLDDREVVRDSVDTEQIQIELKTDSTDQLIEEDPVPDMDPRRFHKKRTRPDAMDIPLPGDMVTRHFIHDVSGPDPSYCDRNSAYKSHGHINRATYYRFDETQEALKVAVCKEIRRCVKRHESSAETKNVEEVKLKSESSQRQLLHEHNCKPNIEVIYKRSGLNKLCSAGFLKQPVDIGVSQEIHCVPKQKERLTEGTVSGIVNQDVQSKTEHLMGLIDKHEALKEKLTKNERDTVRLPQGIGQGCASRQRETNLSKSTGTERQSFECDLGNKKPLTVQNNRILENIQRVSQQSSAMVNDSVKDSDDEDSSEVEALTTHGGVTTSKYGLQHIERTSTGDMSIKDGPKCGSTVSNAQARSQNDSVITSPLDFIGHILLEWKTVETCKFFKGSGKEDDREDFQKKYAALSRKVDAQIRAHSHLLGEEPSYSDAMRKVPEFSSLVKESPGEDLKVKEADLGKDMGDQKKGSAEEIPSEESNKTKDKKKKKLFDLQVEEESVCNRDELITEQGVHLPYLDRHSQTNLRRKIVLDKLNRVLPDLLGPLKLSVRDISTDLRDLVYTFNLSSKNIVLKPAEWTLMGFMVLKLLSKRVKSLKEAFRQDYAVHFFNTVLHGMNATPEKVKEVMHAVIKS